MEINKLLKRKTIYRPPVYYKKLKLTPTPSPDINFIINPKPTFRIATNWVTAYLTYVDKHDTQ